MSDQDEDEFLYGDDAPEAKRLKEDRPEQVMDTEKAPSKEADEDDDDESGSEDDSDSDVEFVINTGKRVEAPTQQQQTTTYSSGKEGDGAAAKADGTAAAGGSGEGKSEEKPEVSAIDLDAVAEHNGVPITQIPIESFANKPWRMPGADVTDYFNYGFDEFSWSKYVNLQDQRRDQYSPEKMMQQMMAGGMGGMPPMDMSSMFQMPGAGGAGAQGANGQQMDMNQMMMMGMMPQFMNQQGTPTPPLQQQQQKK